MKKFKETNIRKGFWKECLLWIICLISGLLLGYKNPATYPLFINTVLFTLERSIKTKASKPTLILIFLSIMMVILEIFNFFNITI